MLEISHEELCFYQEKRSRRVHYSIDLIVVAWIIPMTSADLLIPVKHHAVTKGGTSNFNVPFLSLKLILP